MLSTATTLQQRAKQMTQYKNASTLSTNRLTIKRTRTQVAITQLRGALAVCTQLLTYTESKEQHDALSRNIARIEASIAALDVGISSVKVGEEAASTGAHKPSSIDKDQLAPPGSLRDPSALRACGLLDPCNRQEPVSFLNG